MTVVRMIVLALWFVMCTRWNLGAVEAEHKGRQAGSVEIQMRNVNFRLARDIVLEVHSLRGRLIPTKPEIPVTFDDSASFYVEVDSAEVAISTASLTALMNSYVLAYDGAPIRNVVVTIDGGRVVQKGTVHKKVDLPFEIEGSLTTTEDGGLWSGGRGFEPTNHPIGSSDVTLPVCLCGVAGLRLPFQQEAVVLCGIPCSFLFCSTQTREIR